MLMYIFLFKYRHVKVQHLRQHWMHFVRDIPLAGCYKFGDIKGVHFDDTIFHNHRKMAIITLYKTFKHFNDFSIICNVIFTMCMCSSMAIERYTLQRSV